jgi:hypothetical protein
VIKGADAEVTALVTSGIVDMIPGPGTTPRINTVLAWGANMSWSPSAAYGFGAIQCRDVWPPEAEGGGMGKHAGDTVSPLNFSRFRVALTHIWDMASKSTAIFNYYLGPQTYAIQSIIPPAQAYWFDSSATLCPSQDYAGAWVLMKADGFYCAGNKLYDRNHVECRDLDCYFSTGTTALETILPSFVAAFNDFMDNYADANGKTTVTNCNMVLKNKDFNTLVYTNMMETHDFDIAFLGLTGLGPDPDWTISMFSSEYGVVGGWNFGGVNDPYIDHVMDIILHSTNLATIRAAVYDFQHYFNGEMTPAAIAYGATGKGFFPHFLFTSGMAIASYNPHIMNYIDMPCWGSEQCAEQWMFTSWDPDYTPAVPGAIRRCLANEPTSINPFYENTLYGWLLMDGLEEGLLTRNPQTLEIQPWLAKDYSYEGPINTITPSGKNIVNGMKITYYIREGIYWQDSGAYEDLNDNDHWDVGEPKYEFPFTAYDCKFAADMYMKYKPGRYDTVWTDMIECQTEGPYKFTVWYNASSYWYATYPSSLAMYPQHIYQKADKQVEEGVLTLFSDFKPYTTNYETWTGLHPPDEWGTPPAPTGYWTALVGTGPYIFGYYIPQTMLGLTVKNTRYWGGYSAILQSLEIYCEWRTTFVKEYVGPVITLENITGSGPLYNPANPGGSYWHATLPANETCYFWRLDGWKDGGCDPTKKDGLVSASDILTMSWQPSPNIWAARGEFHVESIVWNGVDRFIMTIRAVRYTAKITTILWILVDFRSMVWMRGGGHTWQLGTDVKYEIFCDGNKIAEGWSTNVGSFEKRYIRVDISSWKAISIGKHTFRVDFSVRQTGSVEDPHYSCSVTRVLYYGPGDLGGESGGKPVWYAFNDHCDSDDFWLFCDAFGVHYPPTLPYYRELADLDVNGLEINSDDYFYFNQCFINFP